LWVPLVAGYPGLEDALASKNIGRRTHAREGKSPRGTRLVPAVMMRDRIYEALKQDIITGVFQAGDALSEKLLAKMYRGSRTPVREAAVRLEHENLLRIVPNRGYFVRHITITELNDLYEYRAALEGACAELAARKPCDPAILNELEQLNVTFIKNDRASYARFIQADTEFHVRIAQLTRNQLLVRAVMDVRAQMERIMYAAINIDYYGESPTREHAQIVQAIREGDAELARKHMLEHIYISHKKVLQLASGNARPF